MAKAERITGQVVKILYEAQAAKWTVKEKAQLLAAVKLSLLPVEANKKGD